MSAQRSHKDEAHELLLRRPGLLACPVCGAALLAGDAYALKCPTGHSFDIAHSGYVNLLASLTKTDYGKDLFEARRRVIASGFFDGLIDALAGAASAFIPSSGEEAVLLDAGCGEGSQLAALAGRLAGDSGKPCCAIGMDISKDGVQIAAREHPGLLWCVADLARTPMASGLADVVFNILSPASYSEFIRVLKPGGALLKAAPGANHLRELRQALYAGADKRNSNDRVTELFQSKFPGAKTISICYTVNVSGDRLADLIAMTPLAWQAKLDQREAVLASGSMEITVDCKILAVKMDFLGEEK